MRSFLLSALVAQVLVGCSNTPAPVPKSPDQALFDVHSAYVGALVIITNYGKQPFCPANTLTLGCANVGVLLGAQSASKTAAAALAAAQPAVDAWKASPTDTAATAAGSAIATAVASVATMQSLVAQIQTH